eukprot:5813816-Amphidinium_carterae.1
MQKWGKEQVRISARMPTENSNLQTFGFTKFLNHSASTPSIQLQTTLLFGNTLGIALHEMQNTPHWANSFQGKTHLFSPGTQSTHCRKGFAANEVIRKSVTVPVRLNFDFQGSARVATVLPTHRPSFLAEHDDFVFDLIAFRCASLGFFKILFVCTGWSVGLHVWVLPHAQEYWESLWEGEGPSWGESNSDGPTYTLALWGPAQLLDIRKWVRPSCAWDPCNFSCLVKKSLDMLHTSVG